MSTYKLLGTLRRISKHVFPPYYDMAVNYVKPSVVSVICIFEATAFLNSTSLLVKQYEPFDMLPSAELDILKSHAFSIKEQSIAFIVATDRNGIPLDTEDARHLCLADVGDLVSIEMSEGFFGKLENKLLNLRISQCVNMFD